jgi:Fe-S-cluster containining protein
VAIQRAAKLTAKAASHICMVQCQAMCCRGPLILQLTDKEVSVFRTQARILDLKLVVTRGHDGSSLLRFSDHAGDHCPMLEDPSSSCRIYEERPERCRAFPEKVMAGCAISGS